MRWKWLVVACLALAAAGSIVLLSLRVGEQASEIDCLREQVEGMRRDAEFRPALIRTELLRMEARLRAWWIDGAEKR